jgi:hypothetical protein
MSKIDEFEKLNRETGWGLIPLDGKKPIEPGWQQWCEEKRPFNRDDFKNGRNAGIPCGSANGILTLDVDDVEKFNKWLKGKGFDLHQTRTHITGKGGPHFIHQYPDNGHRYGNASMPDPAGEVDPKTGKVIRIFDIRGTGGQIVAPGSIHPETGKPYTVRHDIPIAPAPQWMLDLCVQDEPRKVHQEPGGNGTLEGLQIPYAARRLIEQGEVRGRRSEATMSILSSLARANVDDATIIQIFEKYPIGEKYREVGNTREEWLLKQLQKCKGSNTGGTPSMGDLRAYLDFEVGPGQPITSDEICRALGAFNRGDRQNIYKGLSRLVESGELKRDPYKHGAYRRVAAIQSYDLTSNVAQNDILGVRMPIGLNNLIEIRPNQLVGISGRYDSCKSSLLFEIESMNYPEFKIVHILSEEWSLPAIKERQDDLGIPIPHPNISFYPMLPGWEDLIPQERSITLIDYVRADRNPFEVDAQIQRILRNLKGGVAFFATQKHPGLDKPVGGQFAVHSVHHILMLDRWKDVFVCKIFRTKNEKNLEGYFRTFGLNDRKCLVPKMQNWKQGELKWEKKTDADNADNAD